MSMIKMIAVAAVAAIAMAANADTITTNGVTWTYSDLNADKKTVTLGGGSAIKPAMAKDTMFDAAVIPWTFDVEGETYTVTKLADYAFKGCTKLTGTLTIPMAVTSIGRECFKQTGLEHVASLGGVTSLGGYTFEKSQSLTRAFPDISSVTNFANGALYGSMFSGTAYIGKDASVSQYRAFCNCSNLEGICAPGPDAVASGTQKYTTINVNQFAQGTKAKVIFFGPNTKGSDMSNDAGSTLKNVAGCKVYVPANGYWDGFTAGGTDTEVVYYGASADLDFAVDTDSRVVVAAPVNATGLVKALEAAPLFKTHFNLNVRINVTNTLALADVTITEDMTSGVTFDRLMFSAKTQNQLNAILGAFPAATPISIDPTGLTENMVVPETYANVYVKTVPGVAIRRAASGFTIIFY